VSIRSLGRWLYHAITSSDKRLYIESSLEELEDLADESASASEAFKLLGIFDELTYRITSPERRDRLKTKITSQLLRMEGIRLPLSSDREKVSEIRAQLLSRYAERADTERKANEAAAEKERLEAEARAQQEAERKAKEEAAAEKARLDAEARAQKEAERKAKEEAAAEKARLEAEAKAQKEAEEKARKEAERKAKEEAAAEKARLEAEAKAQREDEEKAQREAEWKNRLETKSKDLETRRKAIEEQRRIAEESRKKDLAEQIQKFLEARPLTPENNLNAEEKNQDVASNCSTSSLREQENSDTDTEHQPVPSASMQGQPEPEKEPDRQANEKVSPEAPNNVSRSDSERQSLAPVSGDPSEGFELPREGLEDGHTEVGEKQAAISGKHSSRNPSLGFTGTRSREEEREERRELARLRKLERAGEEDDQSEDELAGSELNGEFEEAEQFAPYLREIPAHWSDWSEQHWNVKLLDYCFVQKANENSSQGLPSTEEDLAFVTGDRESAPAEIAQALVDRVREFSVNRGLSPARLLIKRLETWDYNKPSPPRYFAFLWTTCLIAQGFPCPSEQGEFHKRYERDDVYGSNETQYLSGNLPAAWEQLSKWLDRDDIFDAHAHRLLILPKSDARRSIISHSWKLSFPCRSDRRRLHELVGDDKKGRASRESIDLQVISRLYYQGGFTPEFSAALKQQIDLIQQGNQLEEWLSAIIQREIEAQGTGQDQSGRKVKTKDSKGVCPKIILHLDDDDCYLELVLSSQLLIVDKPKKLSHKPYCAINLEAKEKKPQVVCKLDIDSKQEDLIAPELRVKIEEEAEEYFFRLRHEGLDSAVLAEWSCEGFPTSKPYILFNSETNEITNDREVIGSCLRLLFRRNWDVVLSDGIEAETEEPISVSGLGGWRLLLLARTSPLEKPETISLANANANGEECEIRWVEPGGGKSNSRPFLQGLSLPGQTNGFVMLADSPELWLPPAVTNAKIELFKIKDDEFYMPLGSIQVPSTEGWQRAEVRKLITCPGLYSVKLSYFEDSSDKPRQWTRQILVAEELDIKSLHPRSLQAKYRFKEIMRVVDLERNVSPMALKETREFWNADWLIRGLWAHEKIRVRLDGEGENFSPVLTADNAGRCKIPISAFEPYLLSRESAKLSIQRQGFICQYDLAFLIRSSNVSDKKISEEQEQSTIEIRKRPAQRRRLVYRVDLVVHGNRGNFDIQKMVVDGLDELIEESFDHLDRKSTEYPEGKFARGTRFVFHRLSFADIENESRERLCDELDLLVGSIGNKSGLAFSAEWSRAKE